jgi:hypothetical protein
MSCENTIEIAKGADLSVKITLNDETGAPIDATLLSKLIVSVKHTNGTQIAKFSMNVPATGYEPIDMSNASAGEVLIKLLSTHTNAAPEGKLVYEVHGQYTAGSISDDGVLDIIRTNIYLCTIIKSATGTLTLP